MSTNSDLSKLFSEMAAVLELTGANPFRINAHSKVARILDNLTYDIATIADDKKKLTAIDGIGDGSAAKITEFVATGKVKEHDDLLKEIPKGLLQVMTIPGLGPKTTKLLWDDAGVTDVASLKKALDSGKLENIPRMGAKTIQNIKDSLAFAEKSTERARLGQALPIAEAIIEQLKQVKGVKQIQYAGSLRRGVETIGDIDILASTPTPATLAKAFQSLPGVTKVLVGGENKNSIRMDNGMQVDLRLIDDDAFGAALMYFTGSKAHNVALRERAIKMGYRLNEYGLFPDDAPAPGSGKTKKDDDEKLPPQQRGIKPKAAKTEESIYKVLKLPYIPPELREDRGEIAIAERNELPELITIDDIKAELHAHTIASDGSLTIEELANEAKRRGFHTIAVTDHSKASAQANGLSPERLLAHIDAIREAQTRIKGITILAGSEVDILADGHLDYDDKLLAKLDIVIASPHSALKQAPDVATKRLLAAIRHPLVHILGHPTGRIINRREGLSPDIHQLIDAAVKHNTALEINSHHLRLDLRDIHVKAAVDYSPSPSGGRGVRGEGGCLIAIDTDAHGREDFDELRYGILTARRGWLTAAGCVNTWPKDNLHKWLKGKR